MLFPLRYDNTTTVKITLNAITAKKITLKAFVICYQVVDLRDCYDIRYELQANRSLLDCRTSFDIVESASSELKVRATR